jgi:hypothetical protein
VKPIVFRIICLSGYFFVLSVRPEFSSSNGEEPRSNSQTTSINNPPMIDGTIKRSTTHLATMNILRPDFELQAYRDVGISAVRSGGESERKRPSTLWQ